MRLFFWGGGEVSFFPFALIPTPASYAKKTAAQRREEKGSREIAPSSIVRGPEKRKKMGKGDFFLATLLALSLFSSSCLQLLFLKWVAEEEEARERRGAISSSLSQRRRAEEEEEEDVAAWGGRRASTPPRTTAPKNGRRKGGTRKKREGKKEDWRWCFARLFLLFLPPRSRAIPASLYCHYPSCQEHEFITVAALVFPSPLFLTPFRQSLPLRLPPPLAVLLRLGERRSHAKQTMHLLFLTQYADKRASVFFGGGNPNFFAQ